MPDLYRRSIEPPVAIVLSIGRAVAFPAIAAHLGRFLPRLGPLVATQAAFLFVCTHMELNRRLVPMNAISRADAPTSFLAASLLLIISRLINAPPRTEGIAR